MLAPVPHSLGMVPEKLFLARPRDVSDDMAESLPQVPGSVPVSELPVRSRVCSTGSVFRPPRPQLHGQEEELGDGHALPKF